MTTRFRSKIPVPTFIRALMAIIVVSGRLCPSSTASLPERTQEVTIDAPFRASACPTSDRVWLVGERGAILASDNGGRTWTTQSSRTSTNLNAVAFDNGRVGWIVGGSILPYSHRSQGIVLRTSDAGKTWSELSNPDLPRLVGIQSLTNGVLIAWGDWSSSYQSGLFESRDGGESWTPKSIPSTHLQCAAWLNESNGVVVDRLSRVHLFANGKPARLLPIGADPSKPILQATVNEHGWWLVGAGGQVYRSDNGEHWESLQLPGTPSDHQLISLNAVAVYGREVWLAGLPGNVVWHSSDGGKAWAIVPLPNQLPLKTLAVLSPDVIVAGGMAASILGTRNAGQGWWALHGTTTRVGVLNVAASSHSISWDALAYSSIESRHQVAVVNMHARRTFERADVFPDLDTRIAECGASIEATAIEVVTGFPIGDLNHGRRESDQAAYAKAGPNSMSPAERTAVIAIRAFRPDLLIAEDEFADDPLLASCAAATLKARRLAADGDVRCFSPLAQIPESPWNVQRVLARRDSRQLQASSSRRKNELSFNATTALKTSGMLLGDLMEPVEMRLKQIWDGASAAKVGSVYGDYVAVVGSRNSLSKDTLLSDINSGIETRRSELAARRSNYQAMIAKSQNQVLMQRLLEMDPQPDGNESRWNAAMQSWLRSIPEANRGASLRELALGYLKQGALQRATACLEIIMSEAPSSSVAESAAIQLLQLKSSSEIERVKRHLDERASHAIAIVQTNDTNHPPSSPFQGSIALISHVAKSSRSEQTNQDEPAELRRRLQTNLPWLKNDPRWLLTAAKIDRSVVPENQIRGEAAASARLASIEGSYLWEWIAAQEAMFQADRSKANAVTLATRVYTVEKISERPKLDGKFDEAFWNQAKPIPLSSSWDDENQSLSEVRLAHDGEYLYLSATCPSMIAAGQRWAAIDDDLHIRIDTDRDYLTWFELGVDINENITERCTDLYGWEPRWYFKCDKSDQTWCIEAAIPLTELSLSPSEGEVWNIAFHRELAGIGSQSNRPTFSDRLHPASFMPIQFGR